MEDYSELLEQIKKMKTTEKHSHSCKAHSKLIKYTKTKNVYKCLLCQATWVEDGGNFE